MSNDASLSGLKNRKKCNDENEEIVEEEQAAIIQTIPLPQQSSGVESKSEDCTPSRKVSASRLMNAFTQLYAGNSGNTGITLGASPIAPPNVGEEESSSRTPTKGVESKLLSMWHNVKYGWSGKLRSNFSKEQPVWLLGKCYHRKYTPPSSMESSVELSANLENKLHITNNFYDESSQPSTSQWGQVKLQIDELLVAQELGTDAAENQVAENPWEEGIEGFKRDFYSRIWLTYRREFPIMNGSNYTSDCGWGCMLRSGQMLLAQGLICHFLGRSWRYDPDTQLHNTYEDNMHKKIIRWFGDISSKNSPFSIHALVNLGLETGKQPGDWYGPSSVSHLLRQAVKNAATENADFDNLIVYVAKDCTVYFQDIEDECHIPEPMARHRVPWQNNRTDDNKAGKHWKSLIILIPLRLGTEKLNHAYANCLKYLLSVEYCIGIIGGRPKHSLFFVGFQEDKLIHLDPHYCQEMVDVNQDNYPLHSFHCKSPRKLKTLKMDPSCCIGFYCQTKTDYDNFVENVQMYLYPARCSSTTLDESHVSQYTETNYPLFTFSSGRCVDQEKNSLHETLYKPLQTQLVHLQQSLCSGSIDNMVDEDDGETEEFVIL